ncbi:MAG: putative metal-binding motif-containing protein, partial [Myxococcota bacterium]|nr:putative metal-binding motif-containing protein [Myxococcota bacterium]
MDATAWYLDSDADGYGAPDSEVLACEPQEGMIEDGTDCNDQDADYHPGAVEDDCTDPNDYNCDGSVGRVDLDGDGFAACEDCDDTAVNVNSDAQEVCDGIDNDCDFLVDDADASLDVSTASSWYIDSDLDGYGVSDTAVTACSAPVGTTSMDGDCDDAEPLVNPGAVESCDGLDNDCDGVVPVAELDGDGDGFLSCEDCDDTDPAINPSAVEVCDGVENNCDGLFLTGELTDQDLDGYLSCDDCDDADSAVNAAAVEDCSDGIDNDCDGLVDGQQPACQVSTVDITTSSGTVDLASTLGNPSAPVAVLVTIFPGVTVQSSSTSTPALTTAGLPTGSTVEVLNQGTIHGRGGNGACDNQGAGGHGGDAILVTVDVTIDNASGFI